EARRKEAVEPSGYGSKAGADQKLRPNAVDVAAKERRLASDQRQHDQHTHDGRAEQSDKGAAERQGASRHLAEDERYDRTPQGAPSDAVREFGPPGRQRGGQRPRHTVGIAIVEQPKADGLVGG